MEPTPHLRMWMVSIRKTLQTTVTMQQLKKSWRKSPCKRIPIEGNISKAGSTSPILTLALYKWPYSFPTFFHEQNITMWTVSFKSDQSAFTGNIITYITWYAIIFFQKKKDNLWCHWRLLTSLHNHWHHMHCSLGHWKSGQKTSRFAKLDFLN